MHKQSYFLSICVLTCFYCVVIPKRHFLKAHLYTWVTRIDKEACIPVKGIRQAGHHRTEQTYPSRNPWGAKSSVRNRQLHKWLGSNPISQEQSQGYPGVKERRQTEPKDRAADPSGIQSTLPSQGLRPHTMAGCGGLQLRY